MLTAIAQIVFAIIAFFAVFAAKSSLGGSVPREKGHPCGASLGPHGVRSRRHILHEVVDGRWDITRALQSQVFGGWGVVCPLQRDGAGLAAGTHLVPPHNLWILPPPLLGAAPNPSRKDR